MLLNRRDIDFLLYEFLNTENLLERERYQDHSREVFNAVLNSAEQIAEKYFANHNSKGDANEPIFDGKTVTTIEETKDAWKAFAEGGFLAAHYDEDDGGLQLPEVILRTALAYFNAANVASSGYPFLTIGASNLIHSFANNEYKKTFLPPMQDGRFAGTMALTEPNQGSALADITTRAVPQDDGSYRLYGTKMYISGGDQDITENIIHMVLARVEGAQAGTKGISLFICPKYLVNQDGTLGERNDVQLAGLLHKMGYRNTTSTVLNFGENDGAVAYLVGKENFGLSYMFQMMNEARIGVGLGAATLAYQGFRYSLDFAKQRPQGRLPSAKNPSSPQVNIIEHADVKRMLLAQKAYSEGAVAMCLFASSLVEDINTAIDKKQRLEAQTLLDLITPIIKSWPSKYGVQANDLAIQVLGGSGYIREYPVEQYFRDNRLNPIHEGTEGIQALDLLGRKVPAENFAGLGILQKHIQLTLDEAHSFEETSPMASSLLQATKSLQATTKVLMGSLQQGEIDLGLANATLYLDYFGRIFASWIWLKQATIAMRGLSTRLSNNNDHDQDFYKGKIKAAEYYYNYELPQIYAQETILRNLDSTCFDMQENWY